MNYLIIINDKGERVTTLVEGLHGADMDAVKEYAAKEYAGHTYVEDDGTLQDQLVAGGKIYKDGAVVDAPPHEPTPEEIAAQTRADYEADLLDLSNAITAAFNRGDSELVAKLQEQYKELQEEYSEAL